MYGTQGNLLPPGTWNGPARRGFGLFWGHNVQTGVLGALPPWWILSKPAGLRVMAKF